MPSLNIFLDDGGVITDKQRRPVSLSAWLVAALWRYLARRKRPGLMLTARWLTG